MLVCGGGLASETIAKRGGSVTAIDASRDAKNRKTARFREIGLTIDYVDSHAEAFVTSHKGAFDVVTCWEMIEHVPEPMETLKALAALVQPGGWLILSTINRTPKAYLGAVIAAEDTSELGAEKGPTTIHAS